MRSLLIIWQCVIVTAHGWSLPCKAPSSDDTPISIGVFVPHFMSELANVRANQSTVNLAEEIGVDEALRDYESAINLAIHHIRNHSCTLAGFQLNLIFKSTKCRPSLGMKALFELIAEPPMPVAVFGGMCTSVNEPIAMALKYWNIVQLSYAETHAKFSSADAAELYPTFFRVVPAFRNTNEAKVELISYFNWTRVATIKQSDESRYALPHEKLTALMETNDLDVIYTAGIAHHEIDNIQVELKALKERDARILLMDVEEGMAAIALCEAYKLDMYGPNYVWILPGYHKKKWRHSLGSDPTNCSEDELNLVLEGHFAVEFAKWRRKLEIKLPHGKSAGHVLKELKVRGDNASIWAPFLYDGMWTLANALRTVIDKEVERGERSGSEIRFNYTDILEAMMQTNFQGVTGLVKFDNNERLGIVDILQYRNGVYREIGKYDGTDKSFEVNVTNLEGWNVPRDATIVIQRQEYISMTLILAFSLFSVIGILLSTIFLIVNIRYRNHRSIKMSSPNLNNAIIIGSMFTFVSVILLGIDSRVVPQEHFPKLCYARTWILCFGFTLAFGSMFSKTWRVHSIFTNIRMDKKAIKDSKLFLMLGILMMIDFVVLSAWAFFSPYELEIKNLTKIQELNAVIIPEVETCKSDNSVAFQAVLYVVKGILMILGCFLAWETRHVNIPALNDSKYIGMSVYNVVVMSVLGLSIAFILQDRVNEAYALTCLFIIFSTTLTLCLLFVPKIIPLHLVSHNDLSKRCVFPVIELIRNPQGIEPKGYRRGLMKSVVQKQKTTLSPRSHESEKDLLSRAEAENQLKHRILHEKSALLWELLERLRDMGDTTIMQQEWCFGSSGVVSGPPTTTPDSDPLLSTDHKSERSSSGCGVRGGPREASSTRSKDEWPWVDPDQPSTML